MLDFVGVWVYGVWLDLMLGFGVVLLGLEFTVVWLVYTSFGFAVCFPVLVLAVCFWVWLGLGLWLCFDLDFVDCCDIGSVGFGWVLSVCLVGRLPALGALVGFGIVGCGGFLVTLSGCGC